MSSAKEVSTITYAEIIRQQEGWRKALAYLDEHVRKNLDLFQKYKDRVWVFTGCGTSYYLAQSASSLFEMLTGVQTKAVPASEILIFPQLVFNQEKEYLVVPMSRSGMSTEVVLASQKATEELGVPTFAVSCNPESDLIQGATHSLTFPFETERSVVMTGSFTTMLLSVVHLALHAAGNTGLLKKISVLPDISQQLMQQSEPKIQKLMFEKDLSHFVFLGQGPFLGIANEAALKIQEMSISLSQSYHSLEYRHGPKSTVTENTLITLLFSEVGKRYETHLARDLKALGAEVLVFQNESMSNLSAGKYHLVNVPAGFGDVFNSFLYMPVLQLLGYF